MWGDRWARKCLASSQGCGEHGEEACTCGWGIGGGAHEWGQERRMPGVSVVALGLESVVALTLLGGKVGRECQACG